uniref:Uncharacterized protein n=1 Tax=Lotharella oceanica TaxID=641309 RepID=A0A7S2TK64_9EUKA|mmetsp:Transcript_17834/g.33781  ORF Transcript_17834/g.33781 Transcript_17834/m.33781 type:complete len:172 (+) Transcript_17834:71-586(+)
MIHKDERDDIAIEDIEKELAQIDDEEEEEPVPPVGQGFQLPKAKYGRDKDPEPDKITMDDFNQTPLNLPDKQKGNGFDKKRDWDPEIEAYEKRRADKKQRREEELRRRAHEKRIATLKYIFTGEWMGFSKKCGEKWKCCGRCTGTIVCIAIVVAIVVGTPIVITMFTGGLA